MIEIPYDLRKNRTTGTERVTGFQATLEAVMWWIHTPRWSKINRADFGHEFVRDQHESMTKGNLQDIEARTVIGVERDIDVKVAAVYATPSMDDAICNIAIAVSDGTEMGLIVDRITA